MPKDDPEFVKFAEEIETGAHVLKSMDFYKSMDNCYLTIEMESKLNEILRREYSKTYLKPNADPLKRWENFLLFVEEEKIAAESRIASFAPIITSKKKEEPDGEIGGHFTSTRGGKGGGAGRGRGTPNKSKEKNDSGKKFGRGKYNGGKGVQNQRGKTNNSCLVCNEDHQTSKCYTWTDEKSNKGELLYLATKVIKQPFCIWCLEGGHYESQCKSKEENGCPCGKNINIRFCNETEDCKTRKNWKDYTPNCRMTICSRYKMSFI